jgi:hypothetical protein
MRFAHLKRNLSHGVLLAGLGKAEKNAIACCLDRRPHGSLGNVKLPAC